MEDEQQKRERTRTARTGGKGEHGQEHVYAKRNEHTYLVPGRQLDDWIVEEATDRLVVYGGRCLCS